MRTVIIVSAWLFGLALAADRGPTEPSFVGAERCRLCHRDIYRTWKDTAHAAATDSVPGTENSKDCLRCHATGANGLPGVQCETGHGAGRNYWYPESMMDPDKAKDAGLLEPTESICRSCHGSGLPDHSSQFSMPGETEWERVIHRR